MSFTTERVKVNPTIISNNQTIVIDSNGLLPGIKTTYDTGLITIKVADFSNFSLLNETIQCICKEYAYNEILDIWLPYSSGKFIDNRFTADNTVKISYITGLQYEDYYENVEINNPSFDINSPVSEFNPLMITSRQLKNGLTEPDPSEFIPQFYALRMSALGQGIFELFYKELEREIRN